ncbi:GvpL/GvpF family gas vesicle protein [Nonomuraea sp. NPDC003754]
MGQTTETTEQPATEQKTGCYLYGIVPADVEVDPEAQGVAEARIRTVQHGDLAALVSEITLDRPLGTPDDLRAHEQLLDATAAEVPVLPIRFGAVLATCDAAVEELLAPYHDEFAAALRELEGRAQFAVKGRYAEETVLGEVLEENPEIERLREEIHGLPEDATRNQRIQLGELINTAVAAKREADTAALLEAVKTVVVMSSLREPSHELDAMNVALLVETDREGELAQVVEELGRQWAGRIELRLLGPMAPYDFVVSGGQGGG